MNPKLIDHFMNPRNVGTLDRPDLSVRIGNPVCGDTAEIDLRLADGATTIAAVCYRAYGCSASIATVSLLSEYLTGRNAAALHQVAVADIDELIGDLAPRERHCREFAREIIRHLAQRLTDR
jgi:nitrogen fixation NifU-like protein